MNAADVRDRLASLRAAGEVLRSRRPEGVIEALAAVLDRWRDPNGPERCELERELPAATGFSPANVKAGLALALAPWSGDALRDVTRRALAPLAEAVRGEDTTGVILAGAIPMPTLLAIVEPLALRSPVLAKSASRDPVTAHLVARSIAAVDPALGEAVGIVDFPSADGEALEAFLGADRIVATGSDETIAAVARRVADPKRVLGHGHRLSVAVLGPEAVRGAALLEATRGTALDTALWDQLGCLSPVVVFAPRGACPEVGAALANALAEIEARLPRGAVAPRVEALTMHERSGAELRGATGGDVVVHCDDSCAWTVIVENDAEPRPMPLHRFLRVHPSDDAADLLAALAPYAKHLAGVALAGFGSEESALRPELAALGASRICAPGELQAPPLDWPRDGIPAFAALVRTE